MGGGKAKKQKTHTTAQQRSDDMKPRSPESTEQTRLSKQERKTQKKLDKKERKQEERLKRVMHGQQNNSTEKCGKNSGKKEKVDRYEKADNLTEISPTTLLTTETLKMNFKNYLTTLDTSELLAYITNIPLRLTETERSYLEVIESALEVSEYTSQIDVAKSDYQSYMSFYNTRDVSARSKVEKVKIALDEFKHTIFGILFASNYKLATKILNDRNVEEKFFQEAFEAARRFKASNPASMRTTYQKLMHILQDIVIYDRDFIGPDFVISGKYLPIKTVGSVCSQNDLILICKSLGLMKGDNHMEFDENTNSSKVTVAVPNVATDFLVNSIKDGLSGSEDMCGIVQGMLDELSKYSGYAQDKSLEITRGRGGAAFSHNHSEQYTFVNQSMTLWWNVMRHINEMWLNCDADFLSGEKYSLVNTGQGLQRLQSCPRVGRAMAEILGTTKREVGGGWRGLSVVHLGDRDVPNSLFYIEKYSEVPWILSPILRTVRWLNKMNTLNKEMKEFRMQKMFEKHKPLDWKNAILRHFFQHGFDGSGSDGGSCIDGRLTSAWNWCSMIEKYIYYPIFLLADFEGFDGPFKK
ncbi:hypothetical protein EIN_419690 [Entamoeba invadens IP1]|uniref:Non-canonical E2 ubiquitin-conjugating enzyme C-terminal domain-containing protein n=1 Tax=Entamoeba invadens IP1 TaxID=370355 RepID=A0A0A1U7U8_ENTIV|nr:hypothetical protein EIN_419690 [Entamoeba invadens IP1]ELP88020.1 hypothetical protein EIN_419690 [Entamoeba invadens IP1]|eukprot:XP_004254791.1 hypothetical protein EIN_419690 [Entamoeba invadens IP1]